MRFHLPTTYHRLESTFLGDFKVPVRPASRGRSHSSRGRLLGAPDVHGPTGTSHIHGMTASPYRHEE